MTIYFTFYKKPEYSGDSCFFKIENLNLEKENFNYDCMVENSFIAEYDSHIKKDKICIELWDDFLGTDLLLSVIYLIQSEQTVKQTTIEIFYVCFEKSFHDMIRQIERAAK